MRRKSRLSGVEVVARITRYRNEVRLARIFGGVRPSFIGVFFSRFGYAPLAISNVEATDYDGVAPIESGPNRVRERKFWFRGRSHPLFGRT